MSKNKKERSKTRDESGSLITACPHCGADSYIVDGPETTAEGDPRKCVNGHNFRARDNDWIGE